MGKGSTGYGRRNPNSQYTYYNIQIGNYRKINFKK